MKKWMVSLLLCAGLVLNAHAATAKKVYFIFPKDGATVPQTFEMKFGEKGLVVEPAGKDTMNKKEGHYHVLVDESFYPKGNVIPVDATHIHYGKAQKNGTITLSPGDHKLTLQFADGMHRSAGKVLSQTITIHVK